MCLQSNAPHQSLKVPSPQRQLWAHVCQHQFQKRKYWRNRCMNYDQNSPTVHQAGYRVRGNTAPSRRCPSGLRLGPHGSRCIRATKNNSSVLIRPWSTAWSSGSQTFLHIDLRLKYIIFCRPRGLAQQLLIQGEYVSKWSWVLFTWNAW